MVFRCLGAWDSDHYYIRVVSKLISAILKRNFHLDFQDSDSTSNPNDVDMTSIDLSSVDMTGVDEGGYVLITTNDNQQKLVPVAQFVSVMQQQQHQKQQQQQLNH